MNRVSRSAFWLAAIVAAALGAGCGGSADSTTQVAASGAPCASQGFVSSGPADAPHMLLETRSVAPGAGFDVAVANGSQAPISYQPLVHIQDAASGAPIETGSQDPNAKAAQVAPGATGPCVAVTIPAHTPPGAYEVVLDSVTGRGLDSASLSARFTVR